MCLILQQIIVYYKNNNAQSCYAIRDFDSIFLYYLSINIIIIIIILYNFFFFFFLQQFFLLLQQPSHFCTITTHPVIPWTFLSFGWCWLSLILSHRHPSKALIHFSAHEFLCCHLNEQNFFTRPYPQLNDYRWADTYGTNSLPRNRYFCSAQVLIHGQVGR